MSQTFSIYIKSKKSPETLKQSLEELFDIRIPETKTNDANEKWGSILFTLTKPFKLTAKISYGINNSKQPRYWMKLFSATVPESVSESEAFKTAGMYVFDTLKMSDQFGLRFANLSSGEIIDEYDYLTKENKKPQLVALFVTTSKNSAEFKNTLTSLFHDNYFQIEEIDDGICRLTNSPFRFDSIITLQKYEDPISNVYVIPIKVVPELSEGPFDAQLRIGHFMFNLLRESNLFELRLVHIDRNDIIDGYTPPRHGNSQ